MHLIYPSRFFSFTSDGYNDGDDNKRQRKAPVRFRPSIDIALMQSTLDHRALLVRYGNTKSTWDRVAEAVNLEIQKQGINDIIDSRRCQDRIKRLMDLYREQNFKMLTRFSTNEECKRQMDLLPQLIQQEDERKKSKRINSGNSSPMSGPMDPMSGLLPSPMVSMGAEFPGPMPMDMMTLHPPLTEPTYMRPTKIRKVSPDDILANAQRAAELFEKFLITQQNTLEQTRQILAKQVELEERRLKLEEDKLAFMRQQQMQGQHVTVHTQPPVHALQPTSLQPMSAQQHLQPPQQHLQPPQQHLQPQQPHMHSPQSHLQGQQPHMSSPQQHVNQQQLSSVQVSVQTHPQAQVQSSGPVPPQQPQIVHVGVGVVPPLHPSINLLQGGLHVMGHMQPHVSPNGQ